MHSNHPQKSRRSKRLISSLLLLSCIAPWGCAEDTDAKPGSIVGDWALCLSSNDCQELDDWGRRYDNQGHWIDFESRDVQGYCLDENDQGVYQVEGDRVTQKELSSVGTYKNEYRFRFEVVDDLLTIAPEETSERWLLRRVDASGAKPCDNSPPPRLPDSGPPTD